MNLISWNIRGLGARVKKNALKKLTTSESPSFVLIQEKKLENIDQKTIRACWNHDNLGFVASPSLGNSGGILTIWDQNLFSMESSKSERHWIAICGSYHAKKFKCMLINIYNPCCVTLRREIWNEIEDFKSLINIPCLIMGDFNEVTSLDERGSSAGSQRGANDFSNFINSMDLIDIPPSNGKFSWFRGNSKSRLDRLLLNPEWLAHFPNLKTTLLNRTISDHCPLLATTSEKNSGPKPFRFMNCWTSHPKLLKLIRDSWTSNPSHRPNSKLKALKTSLKA